MILPGVADWLAGLDARTVFLATGVAIFAYYLLVTGMYAVIHVAGLVNLREDVRDASWGPLYDRFKSPFAPGIAVVAPAYNESAVIVDSVQSMLNLNYPDTEVVVVNDGSTDDTLERLIEAFDLVQVEADVPIDIPCEHIRDVYRSRDARHLTVIDKDNGGKADALNAGVWLTEQPLFCAIDADTVIDRDGLLEVVRPFLEDPERTVASGGTVRVANGCTLDKGRVTNVALPGNTLAQIQVMEYLRAFYSGRMGLTKLKSLLIISGAFGLFRVDVVRDVGGYETDSITEDFELVLRMHRRLREAKRDYNVEFVPEPVAWTEVPTDLASLGRQRRRWFRGLIDTLVRHRDVVFNREYGRVGTFALPLFVIVEALGPLVEGLGYVIVPIGFALGLVDPLFFALYMAVVIGVGVFFSWFGVFSEVWSFRRYDEPKDVLLLLWSGVLENFGFRQWKTLQSWRGLVEYLRGDHEWGAMTRSGFDREPPEEPATESFED